METDDATGTGQSINNVAQQNETIDTTSSCSPNVMTTGVDRGWAWLIAFASSWVTFVTYGFITGAGILFVSFISTFQLTRKDASWPISVLSASLKLSAPLVALLCKYLSLRLVSFIGTLAIVLSVGSCYFVNDLTPLVILFGLIQGIGYAHLSIPAILMVNLYFVRYRTIANGIQLAGASLGGLVFPPVIEAIVGSIGLHKYFLCMAAILLTSICAAILFKRPDWEQEDLKQPTSKEQPSRTDDVDKGLALSAIRQENLTANYDNDDSARSVPSTGKVVRKDLSHTPKAESYLEVQHDPVCESKITDSVPGTDETELCRTDGEPQSTVSKDSSKLRIFLVILSHPMFYLLEIIGILMGVGFQIFNQIFVDYAAEWDISTKSASVLISVLSGMDLLGRLATGWITDFGFMTRQRTLQILCLLNGVFCILMTLFKNTYAFMVLNGCSACVAGMLMPLVHVMQAHYFGAENIGMTIALDEFINGLLTLLAPRIIGYFRDTFGSYKGFFVSVGVTFLSAFLLWFLEPVIMKRRQRPRKGSNTVCEANNRKNSEDIVTKV